MIYGLKIKKEDADAILNGVQKFAIKPRTQNYQVGDKIEFVCISDSGALVEDHQINKEKYQITIVKESQWLPEDYVILGIENIKILTSKNTNKNNVDVIAFLNHARPTILDLTEDNIRIIEENDELMDFLKTTAQSYSDDWNLPVDGNTDISPYNNMGWYLAAVLRDDIQEYYIKHGITMVEFLKKKY